MLRVNTHTVSRRTNASSSSSSSPPSSLPPLHNSNAGNSPSACASFNHTSHHGGGGARLRAFVHPTSSSNSSGSLPSIHRRCDTTTYTPGNSQPEVAAVAHNNTNNSDQKESRLHHAASSSSATASAVSFLRQSPQCEAILRIRDVGAILMLYSSRGGGDDDCDGGNERETTNKTKTKRTSSSILFLPPPPPTRALDPLLYCVQALIGDPKTLYSVDGTLGNCFGSPASPYQTKRAQASPSTQFCKLVVAQGVTEICDNFTCDSVWTVTLPSTLTEIGKKFMAESAIQGHLDLTHLKTLRLVGDGCFVGCESLLSVTMPESLEILDRGFSHCRFLRRIDLKTTQLEYFGSLTGCPLLEELLLPDTLIEMDRIHDLSLLKEVSIPDSVTTIGPDTFYNMPRLRKVETGAGSQLTSLGVNFCSRCPRLLGFDMPKSWLDLKLSFTRNESERLGCSVFDYHQRVTMPDRCELRGSLVADWFLRRS